MDVKAYTNVIQLDGGIFCQDGCPVQCNNSIRSLTKLLFSRRTNEDKLTTKQLGLPRPNVYIQQVSTKGREILHPRIGTKENHGREVANALCSISIYHCHFS